MRKSVNVLSWALGGLVLLPLMMVLVLYLLPVPTTFNLTASTEVLSFATGPSLDAGESWWPLENVEVTDASGSTMTFSGYFEPARLTRIRLERVAYGPVTISIEPAGGQDGYLGRLLTWDEQEMDRLSGFVEIRISDPRSRADSGQTLLIPLAGEVTLGRVLAATTSPNVGLLRSGGIRMLGRSWLGHRVFEAGGAELNAGDEVRIDRARGSAEGFLVADERPALTAAFRVIGDRALIQRPGSGDYPVTVSMFDRVVHEPLLRVIFVFLGGLAALAGILSLAISVAEFSSRRRRIDPPDSPHHTLPAAPTVRTVLPPVEDSEISNATESPHMETRPTPAHDKPAQPGSASADSAGRSSGVIATGIACLTWLLSAHSLAAQETVFVRAVEEGQGLVRARGSECFVVLPAHVVKDSPSAQVISQNRVMGVAELELSDSALDLAVLRMREGGIPCREWQGAPALEGLRAVDGYLRIVEETGSLRQIPVEIRESDSRYIVVRPRNPADQIMKTRSGAALIANGQVLGMLMQICGGQDELCRAGDAQVLRRDAIMRYTGDFFDVQAQAAAQSAADAAADMTRIQEDARRQILANWDSMAYRKIERSGIVLRGELPNLRRDVDGIGIMGGAGAYPCCDQAAGIHERRGGLRVLYASVTLSIPVRGASWDLPERIATCALKSGDRIFRRVDIPRAVTDNPRNERPHTALLWGDTAATLPAGSYSLECVIDGLEFESGVVTLSHPVLPQGQFIGYGGEIYSVGEIQLSVDGAEARWEPAANGAAHALRVPSSRRMQTAAVITFEFELVGGAPARNMIPIPCVLGDLGFGNLTPAPLEERKWRVTGSVTWPSRLGPGTYQGRCSLYNGMELFRFTVLVS